VFRVIYRWQVAPDNFDAFRDTWRATTNRIHETVPGALGSFMLRAHDDDSVVLTVAKWDSAESWQRFWGNADPTAMQKMRDLGTRVSVEAFDEIEDHTR